MDFQLVNNLKLNSVLVLSAVFIVFTSCTDNKMSSNKSYQLISNELDSFKLSNNDYYQIAYSDSLTPCIITLNNNVLSRYNIRLGKVDTVVKLGTKEFAKGFYYNDINNICFSFNNYFLVLNKAGVDTVLIPNIDSTGLGYKDTRSFVYSKKHKTVIAQFVDFNNRDKRNYKYDYSYLYKMTVDGRFEKIDLTYSEIYGEGEIGRPKVYLSLYEDTLITISCNLDNKVYLHNLNNQKTKSIVLRSDELNLDKRPQIPSDKKLRLDSWHLLESNYFQYQKAFFDGEYIYRFYSSDMPLKDETGIYYGNFEKPLSVLKISLENPESPTVYTLPSGLYFGPDHWYLKKNGTLAHLRFRKKKKTQNYYAFDYIIFFDY